MKDRILEQRLACQTCGPVELSLNQVYVAISHAGDFVPEIVDIDIEITCPTCGTTLLNWMSSIE